MQQNSPRYAGFDILKYICAFLVVCIHCPFPGVPGQYFTALARIAVPVFFMITGFFYTDILNRNREMQQIRKIFVLAVTANLLFFVLKCMYAPLTGQTISDCLAQMFSVRSILGFLFLNASPFQEHLWYLGAILYVLLIMAAANRLHIRKIFRILTPFLLAADLILGAYSLVVLHQEFPKMYARNYLFTGIPYFCIGMMLRECKKTIHANLLAVSSVIFALTTILERYLLVRSGLNSEREHYISTTFLAVSVFLFMKTVFQERALTSVGKAAAFAGRNYSAWIYIIHPVFLNVLLLLTKKCGIYNLYRPVGPVIVFILSTVFAAFIAGIRKKTTAAKHT